MGFLSNVFDRARNARQAFTVAPAPTARRGFRRLRIEQMEERRVMSASPITIGAVYYDPASGLDNIPNTFSVSWVGGAPGTQLTTLTIDTDKGLDGLGPDDTFFDTEPGGLGVYGNHPLTQVDNGSGITITNIATAVVDGGTVLTLDLSGFTVGKTLVFTIDVDEMGLGGQESAIAEGAEFQGSILTGTFSAAHYFDVTSSATFFDQFDDNFAGSGLNLPDDNYYPTTTVPSAVLTAGAIFSAVQPPKPSSLSGVVFNDTNIDNLQEPGELGIADVSLTLQIWNGSAYVDMPTPTTTTTDANGAYSFNNLAPGQYRVVETQPSGYFSVGAQAGNIGGVIDGVVTTPDIISNVVLDPDQNSVQNDFAEALPGTISGHAYYDPNNNGLIDPGEPGIPNVSIHLYDAALNQVAVTTTDSTGYYQFTNLMPGSYTVIEDPPLNYLVGKDTVGPDGGTLAPPTGITFIQLNSGTVAPDNNFGHLLPASISGMVHVDMNGDCIYEVGEPLLAGVTIQLLDSTNKVIATTTTDANGHYEFDNLTPFATYSVHEVQPAGYFEFGDSVGSAGGTLQGLDTINGATLGSGVNATDYDFCVQLPASISGMIHVDTNGDCIYEPGEPLLSGVTVQLIDSNGKVIATTQTDDMGQYIFNNLQPGTYTVHEVQPAGYFEFGDSVGSAGGTLQGLDTIASVALGSGVNATDYDFCVQLPASISGMIHVDTNGDCIYEPGEPLLAGVTVQLIDSNGKVIATTQTDDMGQYIFNNLQPGTYTVHEVQPAGYIEFGDSVGSAGGTLQGLDTINGATLGSGVNATDYDFCVQLPASISGMIHVDTNGDCIYEPGEPLLAGVTVQLIDSNGKIIATTQTDDMGQYIFNNLQPGTYTVHEVQPVGYSEFGDSVGSAGGTLQGLDTIASVALGSGVNATDYDFCVQLPASLSGFVFVDPNHDGVLDTGDTPIPGVVIQLLDNGGNVIATTTTDNNGAYQFVGIAAGTYGVHEIQPKDFADGPDYVGSVGGLLSNDLITQITLSSGTQAVQYNFTERGFPLLPPTQLGGFVPFVPMAMPPMPLYLVQITPIPAPYIPLVLPYSGGYVLGYTWHLSVIDAGRPRSDQLADGRVALIGSDANDPFQAGGNDVHESQWLLGIPGQDEEGVENSRVVRFGMRNGIPVTGDFNGDGVTDVGFYYDGQWYIDLNGNSKWDSSDLWAKLGNDGDKPVTGDWDGDGKTDIGIFGRAWPGDPHAVKQEPGLPTPHNKHTGKQKNVPPATQQAAFGYRTMKHTAQGDYRKDVIDHVFHYGTPGDIPITGDWHGTGIHTIGLFHKGNWILDTDADGHWTDGDTRFQYGQDGDIPVVGDFNGDGLDELGVYRDGVWFIDTNNDRVLDAHDRVFQLGGAGDMPVVGDWNGDGVDEPGVYQQGGSASAASK